MKVISFERGRIHLLSPSEGDDLLETLTEFAASNGILGASNHIPRFGEQGQPGLVRP